MCDCHLIAGHTFTLQSRFNVAVHRGPPESQERGAKAPETARPNYRHLLERVVEGMR